MEIIQSWLRIMDLTAYLLLIASFVATFLIHGGVGLRQVEILMPNFVPRGADVNLTCHYDMEIGESLYAIKWYKGKQEFYRYVPKEVPPKQVFPLAGVRVVLTKSDEYNVILRDVPLEISGLFKCVVSAETTFQTLEATSHLTVVVIGTDKPVLELERTQYHPGDTVVGHCHTPASFPTANVSWYVDDKQLGDRLIKTEVQRGGDDPVAKTTVSRMSFNLPGNVPSEVMRIKCRATVYNIYDRYAVVPIHPVPRQLSDPHTLLRSGASPGTFGSQYFLQTIKVTCAQRLFFFVVQLLLHHRRLLPFPSSLSPSTGWPTFHC